MQIKKSYKLRLYPNEKMKKEVDARIIQAQKLYNHLLEISQLYYKVTNKKLTKYDMDYLMPYLKKTNPEYNILYSQILSNVADRLSKAYNNFFRRCKEKNNGKNQEVGFPKFKARDRYKSITYPQAGFSIEKEKNYYMLRATKIGLHNGRIKMREGNYIGEKLDNIKLKTLTIKKIANAYYAIFSTEEDISEILKVENTNPIGIDVGLKTFATLSDKTTIQKPKFARNKEKKLAHWQRIVARRKKGSKRREKAKLKVQDIWKDINNQNNDFIQKETTKLVNSNIYTSFIMEDLEINNMVKNHRYARSIQESTWGAFRQILSYKAESAGMKVISVPPHYTTQACSRCLNIKEGEEKLRIQDRTYHCNVCGLIIDRDENASIVIKRVGMEGITLKRARAGQARSHAQGDSVKPQLPFGSTEGSHLGTENIPHFGEGSPFEKA